MNTASPMPPHNPMGSGLYRSVPLAAVILGFATVAMYWTQMPDIVPIHYSLGGEADGFGSKWVLWIIPTINLGLFWLTGKAGDPAWAKYNIPLIKVTEENAERQQAINLTMAAQLRLLICVMLSFIAYTSAKSAVEDRGIVDLSIVFGFIAVIFVVIGYHTYRSVKAA